MGAAVTSWIFTIAAFGELVYDKLPKAGSRRSPPQFIARILMGALCGAAIGASGHALASGLVHGAVGAVAGTFAGYEFRTRLVRATGGKDLPIALLEDAIAIALAFSVVSRHAV